MGRAGHFIKAAWNGGCYYLCSNLLFLFIEWFVVHCVVVLVVVWLKGAWLSVSSRVSGPFLNGRGWSLHWSLHEGLLNSFRLLLAVTAHCLWVSLVLLVVLVV